MSPEDVQRIQESFLQIEPTKGAAGVQLYDHLFARDPSLKPLFKRGMGEQGERIMETIALAVRQLENPYALRDGLHELGARHRDYGVKEIDYGTMEAAFMDMMQARLGDRLTPEAREAWATVFDIVAAMMKEGATLRDAQLQKFADERQDAVT